MSLLTPDIDAAPDDSLHQAFLALRPRLQTHARIAFRHWKCPTRRAEALQECAALAWQRYVRLRQRGRDARHFPMTFAVLVVRAVKSGRRLCGAEPAREVLSLAAQRRHGFRSEPLPTDAGPLRERRLAPRHAMETLVAERLRDNRTTPVPDQVAFRLDWPRFFGALSERDRELAEYLGSGHSAGRAAHRFGLTPGRVSQLRRRWYQEWRCFQSDEQRGQRPVKPNGDDATHGHRRP